MTVPPVTTPAALEAIPWSAETRTYEGDELTWSQKGGLTGMEAAYETIGEFEQSFQTINEAEVRFADLPHDLTYNDAPVPPDRLRDLLED